MREFQATLDISLPKAGALRPEQFNRILARVQGRDSETLNVIYVSAGSARLAATTSPDFFRKTGDPVWLTFDQDKAHLFDAVTERRLRV